MKNEHKTENPSESNKQEKAVKKADDKVRRMNHVFDKMIIPMAAFTVALLIVVAFTGQSCMNSCTKKLTENPSEKQTEKEDVRFYQNRNMIMINIDENSDKLNQSGFVVSDEYDENLTARKIYDANTYSIDYCNNGQCKGILRQNMDEESPYDSVVLGIYSEQLITVDVSVEGLLYSAAFTDEGFVVPSPNKIDTAERILEIVSREKLIELLDMYKRAWLPIFE